MENYSKSIRLIVMLTMLVCWSGTSSAQLSGVEFLEEWSVAPSISKEVTAGSTESDEFIGDMGPWQAEASATENWWSGETTATASYSINPGAVSLMAKMFRPNDRPRSEIIHFPLTSPITVSAEDPAFLEVDFDSATVDVFRNFSYWDHAFFVIAAVTVRIELRDSVASRWRSFRLSSSYGTTWSEEGHSYWKWVPEQVVAGSPLNLVDFLAPGEVLTINSVSVYAEAFCNYVPVHWETTEPEPAPDYWQFEATATLNNLRSIRIFKPIVEPSVSTSTAANVTKSSAELNGVLTDDGGESCQYRFRYREENGDYFYTPWSGSVTTGQSFSHTISDLRHNRTYYFSAQAKNSAGESAWGDEQSFSTKQFMITFDDGPYGPFPSATTYIVDGLNSIYLDDGKPVRAGFFMVGCNGNCEDSGASPHWWGDWLAPGDPWKPKGSVHDNEDIVRYVASASAEHIIGNHTQHHMWFWPPWTTEQEVRAEIEACDKELREVLAQVSRSPDMVFRPPYFVYNPAVEKAARHLGFQIIQGAGPGRGNAVDVKKIISVNLPPIEDVSSVEDIIENATKLIQNWERDEPCVLVFHDASPITPYNINNIITTLRQRFALVHFEPAEISDPSSEDDITQELWGVASGPVDLGIVAPDGSNLSKEICEIPNAFYVELSMSDMDDFFAIQYPETGFYEIYVIPESSASLRDKYSLKIYYDEELVYSESQSKVGDIFPDPYMLPIP